MHCDVLPRRRAAGQDLLAIGRVVDLARVAGAADDAPAAEDAEEPGEDTAVLVRRPCGINEFSRAGRRVDGGEVDAVISARTPTVTTGGAPGGHTGARLGHDGARDRGRGLDDLALHNFTCAR